ncbi:MAG: SDR family oxidoreductase, partial [Chitinophagales bacterium]
MNPIFSKDTFKGKTVFVSGGGSGIGKSIAHQFLISGARVIIASRKQERVNKTRDELSTYGECHAFQLDIRQPEAIEGVIEKIKAKNWQVDILINNAGGQFPSPAESISPNGWNAVINTNLNGTFFMSQQFANAFFIPNKSGKIVNIIANIFRGFPGMAHTGAARAGVDNLSKTLAVEWARYKIRVNAIAPGIIQSTGLEQYPPDFLKGISSKIPLKRLGEIQEVAYLALFMASPFSEFMTGQTVYLDGGQSLWGDMWEIP